MLEEAGEAEVDGGVSEDDRGGQVEFPLADVAGQEELGMVQQLHPRMLTISMFSCSVMG